MPVPSTVACRGRLSHSCRLRGTGEAGASSTNASIHLRRAFLRHARCRTTSGTHACLPARLPAAAQIKSLQQNISATEKAAKALPDKDACKDALLLLKQAKDVVNGLGPGGDLRKFCKPRNPMLVRLLLGDKVNMVAIRRDVSQVRAHSNCPPSDRAALRTHLSKPCRAGRRWRHQSVIQQPRPHSAALRAWVHACVQSDGLVAWWPRTVRRPAQS